jgi:hypothetical protein
VLGGVHQYPETVDLEEGNGVGERPFLEVVDVHGGLMKPKLRASVERESKSDS